MSGIETGKSSLSDQRFALIAQALDTTPEAISELIVPDEEGLPRVGAAESFDWRLFPRLDLDPVLNAAINCFVSTGYHGATMRSVAAEAGISVPGVYHHYPNKQSLLVAVFQVAAAELTAHIRGALADATNASTRLVNLSEATVLFAAHRRDLTAITITDRHLLGGAAATAAADEFNRLVAAFAHSIAEASSVHDAPGTARAATEMCLSVHRWFDGDASDAARTAQQYADYVKRLAGLT